jgi:hypothetical protein
MLNQNPSRSKLRKKGNDQDKPIPIRVVSVIRRHSTAALGVGARPLGRFSAGHSNWLRLNLAPLVRCPAFLRPGKLRSGLAPRLQLVSGRSATIRNPMISGLGWNLALPGPCGPPGGMWSSRGHVALPRLSSRLALIHNPESAISGLRWNLALPGPCGTPGAMWHSWGHVALLGPCGTPGTMWHSCV